MVVSFGRKIAWIAAANTSVSALAKVLRLSAVTQQGWEYGIQSAYGNYHKEEPSNTVYITPVLQGWTLCVGTPFFRCAKGLSAAVSRQLDGREVQYFATERISETHAVERAIDGNTTRSFSLTNGRQFEDGPVTLAETQAGFILNPSINKVIDWNEYWWCDEEYILRLAGNWSVNPSLIEIEFPTAAPGWIGELPLAPLQPGS